MIITRGCRPRELHTALDDAYPLGVIEGGIVVKSMLCEKSNTTHWGLGNGLGNLLGEGPSLRVVNLLSL